MRISKFKMKKLTENFVPAACNFGLLGSSCLKYIQMFRLVITFKLQVAVGIDLAKHTTSFHTVDIIRVDVFVRIT